MNFNIFVIFCCLIGLGQASYWQQEKYIHPISTSYGVPDSTLVATHDQIIRNPVNHETISTQARVIDTPHSHVTGSEIKIFRPAIRKHYLPVYRSTVPRFEKVLPYNHNNIEGYSYDVPVRKLEYPSSAHTSYKFW